MPLVDRRRSITCPGPPHPGSRNCRADAMPLAASHHDIDNLRHALPSKKEQEQTNLPAHNATAAWIDAAIAGVLAALRSMASRARLILLARDVFGCGGRTRAMVTRANRPTAGRHGIYTIKWRSPAHIRAATSPRMPVQARVR